MLSRVNLDQPSPRFSLGFLPIPSASKDSQMTSHFIDLFSKRAAEANKTASSSSRLSPPNPAGNLGSSSIEQAELDGAREDGCTFCEIAAGEQEAYKVSLRRKRFRFHFSFFDESVSSSISQVFEDEFVMAFLGKSSSLFGRKPSVLFCTRIPQIFSQFDQVTCLSSPRSTMKECELPSHAHTRPS